MNPETDKDTPWQQLRLIAKFNQSSCFLLNAFLLIVIFVIFTWWPLANKYLLLINWSGQWWTQIDWLLICIFLFMNLIIALGADIKADIIMILIGVAGGYVIELWGTQTNIWFYYTNERPPIWIIPAWPTAALAIDRMVRIIQSFVTNTYLQVLKLFYFIIFPVFYLLMLIFTFPTLSKSLTIMSLSICLLVILTTTNFRITMIIFLAGSGLGYFLEFWGTTRHCWTYYTYQTPPLFAIYAHGMASVIFWRVHLLIDKIISPICPFYIKHWSQRE